MSYEKYLKYKTKYLNLKNIKMIGGNLSELDSLDVSVKTIILVCDYHEKKEILSEYLDIIKKQKEIINVVLNKFGQDKTYFYSEAPEEFRELVLESDNLSSSAIAQYAITKLPVKFSNITHCDRRNNQCNNKYLHDILSIFDNNSNINCIIVIIGLLHVPYLKILINDQLPDIKIIIVNTISTNQLNPLIREMTRRYPPVIDLLKIESPYELPIELPIELSK